MSYKKHIRNNLSYGAFGTIGILLATSITGCDNGSQKRQEAQNAFFVVQQKVDGSYEVIERHPTSGPTRGIVKDQDGNERFLSHEELKEMVKVDAQRLDQNQQSQVSGGGMSMGEAIMAAAGGAIIGNLIGSALANRMSNNQRFQSMQKSQMNKPGFSQNVNRSNKSSRSSSKRGFFGKRSSGSRSFGGFGG
jgi:hypothetical protein